MKWIYLIALYFLFTGLVNELTAQGDPEKLDSVLWEKAISIHHQAFVADAHAHQLVFGKRDKEKYYPEANQLDIDNIQQGGINAIGLFFAYYPLKNQTLYSKVKADMNTLFLRIDDYNDDIKVVSNEKILDKGDKEEPLFLIPGVEYFYGALDGKISTIDSLYHLGIRAMTLMDNKFDRLSYGNEQIPLQRNLNSIGERVIERMNTLGMLIDISHLDDRMQLKVIEHSDVPVIASHSPVRGVHNVDRNIPDYILKRLVQKDGAIMITFNSGALAGLEAGRCKIEKLIDHIDHAVKVVGINHVGIGSDFNGAGKRSPQGLEDASGFPLITYHLLKRGYTKPEIKKILGENYIRLLSKVMTYRRKSISDDKV